ncbi:hypothetical protein HBI56_031160 [Parastagonospora nodorum]|uniref:Uncharacterized protein n=1 Tax=Phaeosphaeria nodorum (strain SN15 / ATCC MYA-4574 / FGSC 10173) TaxID=321614 RepID=A0A7U2EYQ7_PHANO|nr:hypothetical protein HBH56_018870 [Parastagonospora nodorum]QRC95301.1 hypothetical protein JI435_407130 [Parastagonospora nodorum SN15]KAH3936895.1 hypothetical protein HBH54_015620 [Parastagonospora nodorum]KAH3953931.1 hypothetical protein HBH53_027790 [Parastagonospora nodorum]KAH3962756.1 hypothetical protein HBH51_174030 [Parastagonospora nodorum]
MNRFVRELYVCFLVIDLTLVDLHPATSSLTAHVIHRRPRPGPAYAAPPHNCGRGTVV